MANMFSLILVIATIVTGFFWCFNKFIYSSKKNNYHKECLPTISDEPKKETHKKLHGSYWVENIASIFPMLLFVFIVRSFIYEPFQIPSGSMVPTLLVGDFILVEKFAYGIKDPFYQKTIIKTGLPKRGDVVVFKYPEDPRINYIKRVISLPGDKITYNHITKEISIYPNCNSRVPCDNILPIKYSDVKSINYLHNLNKNKIIDNFYDLKEKKEIERKETLGNITHNIITSPSIQDQLDLYYYQLGQPLATWIVPPECYFVMGDNRDNSSDSRYWGFVPEANLIGKATAIWMSFEKQENKWLTDIRLTRIGKIY